ncbi:MAG: hypothetical protein FJ206_04110 [Gemmatimonadetes bacterium]|nr:hypothetical protein [Gemmatimonadota bacterium]
MRRLIITAGLVVGGCQGDDLIGVGGFLDPPTGLSYQVEASGTPGRPSGVVLRWSGDDDPDLEGWNVYGRDGTSAPWTLRAATTSNSYHDNGEPQLQYYVTAYGAGALESAPSQTVTVDERLVLDKPATLASVTLNRAIALVWSDNSYRGDPDGFGHYRVYSTSYDLDRDLCGNTWHLEGTTVAPEFRVGALVNGVSRCFGVSAVAVEGFESLWSPLVADTPRPDARNVALTARAVSDQTAGFRFWRDLNGNGRAEPAELGLVGSGSALDLDFRLERDGAGRLLLVPVRTGTAVVVYGNRPVGDLTDIDVAPLGGYSRAPVEPVPGWGYVFEMDGPDRFARYGAVRVSHVGRDLIIFDWAYQTDPGNPELITIR